MHYNKVQVTMN